MAIDPREPETENDFPPDILAAFAAYPAPSPSRGFTGRFWAQWETRRARYRGLAGLLRRVWEIEIEGVAVWRLAASTLYGGAICALFFGLVLGASNPSQPLAPPLPQPQVPSTAMSAFAFYNRDWENEFTFPKAHPKAAPPRAGKRGGEFSWTGLNGHLA